MDTIIDTKLVETNATASGPYVPATTEQAGQPPVDQVPALEPMLASQPAEEIGTADVLPPKKRRGFAAMDRAKVRELARRGGAAAHARGVAHQFTTEEAREAGRKGGRAAHRAR